MGSTERAALVDQLQQEMDTLNQIQYSTDFSQDINSKMQMPSRLSVAPDDESFLDDTLRENGNPGASPAHAMAVPERIMLAGSGSHVGIRDSPLNLSLDEQFPAAQPNVGLTTPPRTLKMEEIVFPTVGAESEKDNKNIQRSGAIQPDEANLLNLQKKLKLLSRKVTYLEEQSKQRDKQQNIIIAVGVIYLLYKGFTFLKQ